MYNWEFLYKNNTKLDKIFNDKYSSDKNMYYKNCIEFLVELGEFINETKCFKYWSIKKPNREDMLEELADVITMLMYFYNELNFEFEIIEYNKDNDDLLSLVNDTYYLGSKLYKEASKKLLDKIFKNIINISIILEIEEKEILDSLNNKQKKVEERLNSEDY